MEDGIDLDGTFRIEPAEPQPRVQWLGQAELTANDTCLVGIATGCARREVIAFEGTAFPVKDAQAVCVRSGDHVPFDGVAIMPANVFSYVLQDWDQGFCVEQAFGQAAVMIERILGLQQSVD